MTMQPSGWGGSRQGVQGRGYAQRTDLMQGPRTTGAPAPGGPPPQEGPQFTRPDDVPNLTAPSVDERPLTDGLPVGPGRGPDALVQGPGLDTDKTLLTLRVLYEQTGSQYLLRLMNRHKGLKMGMRTAL
jgi:hypothetical protein